MVSTIRYDVAYNHQCFLDTHKGILSCFKSQKTISVFTVKKGCVCFEEAYTSKKLKVRWPYATVFVNLFFFLK